MNHLSQIPPKPAGRPGRFPAVLRDAGRRFLRRGRTISRAAACLAAAGLFLALSAGDVSARHLAEQEAERQRVKWMLAQEQMEAEQQANALARAEARKKRREKAEIPPDLEESAARDEARRRERDAWEDSEIEEEWDEPHEELPEEIDEDQEYLEDGAPSGEGPYPADEEFPEDGDYYHEAAADAAANDWDDPGDDADEAPDGRDNDTPGNQEAAGRPDPDTPEEIPEEDPLPENAPPSAERRARPPGPPPELLGSAAEESRPPRRPRVVIRQRSTEAATEIPDEFPPPEEGSWRY